MEKEGEEEGEQEGEGLKSSSRHQTCPMTLLPLSYPLPNHNHNAAKHTVHSTELAWQFGQTQL